MIEPRSSERPRRSGVDELRRNSMMRHLLDALERGVDIGHYGRLVFVMVARHFLSDGEMIRLLTRNREFGESEAAALCEQVREHGYNPPRRAKIREWQTQQQFPICPDLSDPTGCNVYRDLKFPDEVYQQIEEFYEEKVK